MNCGIPMSRRAFVSVGILLAAGSLTGCGGTAGDSQVTPVSSSSGAYVYSQGDSGFYEAEGNDMEWVDVASDERAYWNHMSPDPAEVEGTVLAAGVDPSRRQVLYLWEEGAAPNDGYRSPADVAGFRPSVTCLPAQASPVRGAVLLCAGGAFSIRGSYSDCFPTARELVTRGYACFVVHYRLGQQIGAIDLARAVRFVRAHATDYGYDPDAIAVMGYSAGGILAGEFLLNWDGDASPASYDPAYVPDALDEVPARASAAGMIYGFYGHLSVSEKDPDVLASGSLPPTFFCWGTRDPFAGQSGMNYSGGNQYELCAQACEQAGVPVERRVLDGWGHGYGAQGGWIDDYVAFLEGASGI